MKTSMIKRYGIKIVGLSIFLGALCNSDSLSAQPRFRHSDFHAGVHSGSWTLKREQILEEESKDPHRSCRAPYCNRCSKHLADYGHQYQFVGGPSQRQLWYRGTAGSIAHVTQRCYDEHGCPYAKRGRPGAVMSWEYQRYLNHAICDQIRARNAVAAEEAAEERVALLTELCDAALVRALQSEEAWKRIEESGVCVSQAGVCEACGPERTEKSGSGRTVRVDATVVCDFCAAKAQYRKDQAYLAEVEREWNKALLDWRRKTAVADEVVRIALTTKEDADKATRFKRIQHKPPKYQEVLAAREAEAAAKVARENGDDGSNRSVSIETQDEN